MNLVLYVFCNVSFPFIDLICYVGYKFLLTIIIALVWIIFKNNSIYWICLIGTSVISMIFMVRKHYKIKNMISN
jgi:hypothetical protein